MSRFALVKEVAEEKRMNISQHYESVKHNRQVELKKSVQEADLSMDRRRKNNLKPAKNYQGYISARQAARELMYADSVIINHCASGRIQGFKFDGLKHPVWFISVETFIELKSRLSQGLSLVERSSGDV